MTKQVNFKNIDALAEAAAERILTLSKEAIKESGRFTIALSGGTTPATLFKLLATPHYSNAIDWKKVFVFWGDERCISVDSDQNNSHNAKLLLLDKVDIPSGNIFPVPVNEEPSIAAKHYEESIKRFFGSNEPRFDLILLGMGDNGHTASLFPHTTVLQETTALVKEIYVEEVKMDRITFTAPFINNAKHILFLVAGKDKAPMLKLVLEGEYKPEEYPAQLIKDAQWFISS